MRCEEGLQRRGRLYGEKGERLRMSKRGPEDEPRCASATPASGDGLKNKNFFCPIELTYRMDNET